MSLQESREETYNRIKKRIKFYRYRFGFFAVGTLVFGLLLILSVFPLVPIAIASLLDILYSNWTLPLWFSCIGIFAVLLWIFQRFAKKIKEESGITLEEEMYVHAYEALCHLREYSDPNHPIIGGKSKAERRVSDILTLLGNTEVPNATLIREEVAQLWQLRENLRTRLLPSIKKYPKGIDSGTWNNAISSLNVLIDYLSKPELPSLVALNKKMTSLPEITEISIYDFFRSALLKRSNLRHVMAFSVASVVAMLISYVDLNYLDASHHDAFTLGVSSFIALVTLYVTYLGLTVRREQRT